MKNLFLTKTRWLVTIILLTALGIGNVWGEEKTGTIAFSNQTGALAINSESVSGPDDLGNTWSVTTDGTTSFTANSAYYQVGSSKSPATSITFTTTLASSQTITSMSAKFGGFSGTAGKVTLKVGDNTIGTGTLNAANDVTVSSTDGTQSGTVLTVTVTGISKGVKCYYISYTYSTGGGGGCSECTYYVYNGSTWVSIGTTGFDDVVLAPPTVPGNAHGAGNGCWTTDKDVFTSCTYYASGDKFRYVPNPGGAAPTSVNKPGSGTCELYAVYAETNGCLSTTVTAVACARIWEEPDNLAVSSVSSTGATLSWDAIDGVSSYHVIVTKVSNSSIVFDENVTGTSKSLTSLASGTEYSWKVAANSTTDDACDSNFSNGDNFTTCASGFTSLTPTVTADKTGKNGGEALFELSGATSYSVTLKNNSTNAVIAGYNNVSNTSGDITFSGLTASTTYRVEVIAHNACGDNSQTGSETFTTDAATLYTVTWSVNGSTYTTTENVSYNTTTSTPANPSVPSECTGSTFMGWTATKNYTGDSAPGNMFNGTTPTITGDITFYAVFADEK